MSEEWAWCFYYNNDLYHQIDINGYHYVVAYYRDE
jgi:hypothetical protein